MTLARDQFLWLNKYAFPFQFFLSLFLDVYKKWGSIFTFEVHNGCLFCPVKIFTVESGRNALLLLTRHDITKIFINYYFIISLSLS